MVADARTQTPVKTPEKFSKAFAEVLLGTAVGDALGLPSENLHPQQIRDRWKGNWQMRLLFGHGMVSDDTEHTLLVAQTLLSEAKDPDAFQRRLAWKLRWWFASLPAGVGLATARACMKLWLGYPATRAAVTSAGSGPAMRSAILGAFFADDPHRRTEFTLASARLTHRGWQAETAALAVAECAALAVQAAAHPEAGRVLDVLRSLAQAQEWQKTLSQIESSLAIGHGVKQFADALGLRDGVTGYALHIVPVAIYAWLRHPDDFRQAMTAALDCGGDTDTVGAVLGGLLGASAGDRNIPEEWLSKILEWPRSVTFMKRLAARLSVQKLQAHAIGPVRYCWPGLLARNSVFLVIVLSHGLLRIAAAARSSSGRMLKTP